MDLDIALELFGLVLLCGVFVLTIWLGVVDWRTGRLPNPLVAVLATLITGMLLVEFALEARAGCRLSDLVGECVDGFSRSLGVSVLLVAAGFSGPLLMLNLMSPASMGFGDVKLAFVLSGVLGLRWWSVLPSPLFVGVGALSVGLILGLVSGLIFRRGEDRVPLGPGLIAGVWLVGLALAIAGLR